MTETPLGEYPAHGGNVRQYETTAERARAWRERQQQRHEAVPAEPVSAALAEATLSTLLERLGEVLAGHHATVGELVGRVEDAVAVLADPDAVAEELAAARAETAREVAAIQERVARAQQAKTAAEAATREAIEAANEAWSQLEAAQGELENTRAALRTAERATVSAETALAEARADHEQLVEAGRRQHAEALADAGRAHQAEISDLRQHHEQVVADLTAGHEAAITQLRDQVDEQVQVANRLAQTAEAERARAEGTANELRADLERTRQEHAQLQAAVPQQIDQARTEVAENLGVRHRLELDAARATAEGQLARLQGELSGATARAEAAERLAQVYQREAERLATQLPPAVAPAPRRARGPRGSPSAPGQ